MKRVVSLLGFFASIVVCVVGCALVLAALPASHQVSVSQADGSETVIEVAYTYSQKLRIIRETVYQRALRPRPPTLSDGYRNWMLTLQSATPILLTGLAMAVAFRANVLNIGAQGQYICGAIAATAGGLYLGAPGMLTIPMMLVGAALAGACWSGIAALLERGRGVPVVLSTLLLNFVALELLRYLLQGPMRAPGLDPQSEQLPEGARLPMFFLDPRNNGVGMGLFIAVGAALLLWGVLKFATFGFRLRVVGQNAVAARFAGMNVSAVSFATLALSGALAGVAGGVQVAGVPSYSLFPDLGTDAIGFTGIAVALLARLSPVGVIFSALFFGLFNTALRALEISDLKIHHTAAQAVQGVLVISILIASSGRLRFFLRRPFSLKTEPGEGDSNLAARL